MNLSYSRVVWCAVVHAYGEKHPDTNDTHEHKRENINSKRCCSAAAAAVAAVLLSGWVRCSRVAALFLVTETDDGPATSAGELNPPRAVLKLATACHCSCVNPSRTS